MSTVISRMRAVWTLVTGGIDLPVVSESGRCYEPRDGGEGRRAFLQNICLLLLCTCGSSYNPSPFTPDRPQLLPFELSFCEKTRAEVTCMQSVRGVSSDFSNPKDFTITCYPSCPGLWQETRTLTPQDGLQYQYALTVTFVTTKAWNSVVLRCFGFSGARSFTSTFYVTDEPSVSLTVTNQNLWVGQRQTSTCRAEVYCLMDSKPLLQFVANCAVPDGCIFEFTQRDSITLEISFNASAAWNGSSVHCSLTKDGLWLSPSQTLIVYDVPKLTLSPVGPHFWNGTVQRIKCKAIGRYDLIAATHPIQWNITCFDASGCKYDAENLTDGAMVTFSATKLWNYSMVTCHLNMFTKPYASLTVVVVENSSDNPTDYSLVMGSYIAIVVLVSMILILLILKTYYNLLPKRSRATSVLFRCFCSPRRRGNRVGLSRTAPGHVRRQIAASVNVHLRQRGPSTGCSGKHHVALRTARLSSRSLSEGRTFCGSDRSSSHRPKQKATAWSAPSSPDGTKLNAM